ncbi:MAG: division/cell wall cluster transcriptional repressor MraZ [Gammaproteobacteria bacterium]|nr:division/cell wall cluster transcriptional repressor MraZ [Gammaproteobacteria bacterium]
MFRGSTQISLDAKGRMALPARYRDRLRELSEGKMVITYTLERYLQLVPLPTWLQFEEKLVKAPVTDKRAKAYQMIFISNAVEVDMDSSGRVLIPQLLREGAGIDKHVILSGMLKTFHILPDSRYQTDLDDAFEYVKNYESSTSEDFFTDLTM